MKHAVNAGRPRSLAHSDTGLDLPYRQSHARCLAAAIGATGLSDRQFSTALAETAPILETLRRQRKSLPLFAAIDRRDDFPALADVAARFRGFNDVLVFGTGGSSLGGRTLTALAPARNPRLWFLDNLDADSFTARLANVDLRATGILVISKSGTTAETVAQLGAALPRLRAALGDRLGSHVAGLADPGDNPLRRIGGALGFPVLDHDPGIGGRFSALSATGVLPAMIAGIDVAALRRGAARVLDGTLAGPGAPPAIGAALNAAFLSHRGLRQVVLLVYADRLEPFAQWFRQLWAESLGKSGQGSTPISALGPLDQHSQLQLYLDGPNDKLFTVVTVAAAGTGPIITEGRKGEPAFAALAGRSIGDLVEAEQRATVAALAKRGRPVRVIHLPRLDEAALGGLLMHFMLETMILAGLWGVEAFGQPAVEEGKALALRFLAEGFSADWP
ncbi:MAG: glucose-6-phosphate isomerase [Rhodospirillaceae bacterium]|nr:glucose-6-phosphate isomerase [Rhodospirillaceae bacterium]